MVARQPDDKGRKRWYCIFWAINKKGFKKIMACTSLSKAELWKTVENSFVQSGKKPWGNWGTQEVIPALIIPDEWKKFIRYEKKDVKRKSTKKFQRIFDNTIVYPTHYKLEKYEKPENNPTES